MDNTGKETAPPGVDLSRPSPARIYDVFLGGKDNFAVDRAAARVAIEASPDVPQAARENRAFLGRAVRFLVEAGVRQFVDIGTGLPTGGHVHEITPPDTRVVYVDNDPIVLAHANALLPQSHTTTVIQADLRDPESILGHPELRALVDFDRPLAVLMVAVLHFTADEEAKAALAAFTDALPRGGYLAISHTTMDGNPERGPVAARAWDDTLPRMHARTHAQVSEFFTGYRLVEPGVVWLPEWRPAGRVAAETGTRWFYAGVGERT